MMKLVVVWDQQEVSIDLLLKRIREEIREGYTNGSNPDWYMIPQ
jgi:hypothetical protein